MDENTIAIVAIAGHTFADEDDDFQGIHDLLDNYERKTGISIPMLIDGASGGFVNPFLYPVTSRTSGGPRVQSINASGHKYGLTPPGLGWVIFGERKVFNDLVFYVNYLGGEMPTATLNFSRNGFQIAVQYYNCLRLGFDGYERVMRHTLDNAIALRKLLVESGQFKMTNESQRIPVVAVTLYEKAKRFNEFDVSNKMREKGWVLSAYSMSPNAQEVRSLRVVVRPHINRNVVQTLWRDIISACKYLVHCFTYIPSAVEAPRAQWQGARREHSLSPTRPTSNAGNASASPQPSGPGLFSAHPASLSRHVSHRICSSFDSLLEPKIASGRAWDISETVH